MVTDASVGANADYVRHARELKSSFYPVDFVQYQFYLRYLLRHQIEVSLNLARKVERADLADLADRTYPKFNRVSGRRTVKELADLYNSAFDLAEKDDEIVGALFAAMASAALGALMSDPKRDLQLARPHLAAYFRTHQNHFDELTKSLLSKGVTTGRN